MFFRRRNSKLRIWHEAATLRFVNDAWGPDEDTDIPDSGLWHTAILTAALETAVRLDAIPPKDRSQFTQRDGWQRTRPENATTCMLAMLGWIMAEATFPPDNRVLDGALPPVPHSAAILESAGERREWLRDLSLLHIANRKGVAAGGFYIPSGVIWELIFGAAEGQFPMLTGAMRVAGRDDQISESPMIDLIPGAVVMAVGDGMGLYAHVIETMRFARQIVDAGDLESAKRDTTLAVLLGLA